MPNNIRHCAFLSVLRVFYMYFRGVLGGVPHYTELNLDETKNKKQKTKNRKKQKNKKQETRKQKTGKQNNTYLKCLLKNILFYFYSYIY